MATAHSTLPSPHALRARLREARRCSDELFRVVRSPALYERPIPERHRIVFYIGHLEAFDWNLIGKHVLGLPESDAVLDRLFAFGIDPVDGRLPADVPADWPSLECVHAYVSRTRAALDAALSDASFDDPRQPLLLDGYILQVAIEHRLMHLETLAYMLHRLPLEQKAAPAPWRFDTGSADVRHTTIRIPAGTATLGLRRAAGRFGWDNEFEEHRVALPAFTIGKYKVTNGLFLKFVNEGGYRERSLWNDRDWRWKEEAGLDHPQFWVPARAGWKIRTMFAEVPLPLDWPVYVSHAEATAYARWAGGALPTEAQFHRAAYGTPDGAESEYPWGSEPPSAQHGNFDFARWDPTPVNAFPAGDSAFGVADLLGNGWEWTATVFAPLPGFAPFPFYPGYSADFFDGKHYVMKGGSPRTAACMLRRSFRNWFQGRYPHVYAGFRIVQEEA
jgi:ergothioneine biosynthesis protein EgtB